MKRGNWQTIPVTKVQPAFSLAIPFIRNALPQKTAGSKYVDTGVVTANHVGSKREHHWDRDTVGFIGFMIWHPVMKQNKNTRQSNHRKANWGGLDLGLSRLIVNESPDLVDHNSKC